MNNPVPRSTSQSSHPMQTNVTFEKLREYVNTMTMNNTNIPQLISNITEHIDLVKQNMLLNERVIQISPHYIDSKALINNWKFNKLILINPNPLITNCEEKLYEWYSFLNSILYMFKNDYNTSSNYDKKMVLKIASDTYGKKIKSLGESFTLSSQSINDICISTNIQLYIIELDNTVRFFGTSGPCDKIGVLCKINNDYFPFVGWNKKYFDNTMSFVKYLQSVSTNGYTIESLDKRTDISTGTCSDTNMCTSTKIEVIEEKTNDDKVTVVKKNPSVRKLKKVRDVEMTIEKITVIENNTCEQVQTLQIQPNEEKNCSSEKIKYEEIEMFDNNALFESEAIEKPIILLSTHSDGKKKSKKDIFVCEANISSNSTSTTHSDTPTPIPNNDETQSSVFRKTEDMIDTNVIKQNLKNSTSLVQLQQYALKLNINITHGVTKSNKLKNKTKNDLIEDIKKVLENLSNN